jgi:hypothetical protein
MRMITLSSRGQVSARMHGAHSRSFLRWLVTASRAGRVSKCGGRWWRLSGARWPRRRQLGASGPALGVIRRLGQSAPTHRRRRTDTDGRRARRRSPARSASSASSRSPARAIAPRRAPERVRVRHVDSLPRRAAATPRPPLTTPSSFRRRMIGGAPESICRSMVFWSTVAELVWMATCFGRRI